MVENFWKPIIIKQLLASSSDGQQDEMNRSNISLVRGPTDYVIFRAKFCISKNTIFLEL